MNIQAFSMIEAAYMNPLAYGNFQGINKSVWMFNHLFADQKFMTIFSILCGVGIIPISQKVEKKGRSSIRPHYSSYADV